MKTCFYFCNIYFYLTSFAPASSFMGGRGGGGGGAGISFICTTITGGSGGGGGAFNAMGGGGGGIGFTISFDWANKAEEHNMQTAKSRAFKIFMINCF
ncbi:MAG: hypothetical protein ABI683_09915 [Ginsengibacter sp.]